MAKFAEFVSFEESHRGKCILLQRPIKTYYQSESFSNKLDQKLYPEKLSHLTPSPLERRPIGLINHFALRRSPEGEVRVGLNPELCL